MSKARTQEEINQEYTLVAAKHGDLMRKKLNALEFIAQLEVEMKKQMETMGELQKEKPAAAEPVEPKGVSA